MWVWSQILLLFKDNRHNFVFGLGFYVLALNYQSFSGGFWDIKEQKIKKMCEFVMLKLKEWNQKNNDEIKRIKVKDCFWHSKFDNWVNSE